MATGKSKFNSKFSFMEEWKLTKIGSLCKRVCSGGTPKSTVEEYYGGGIPWLNTKEVNFNRIYYTESTISESGLNNSSAKWIDAHSVIVAMYGATAAKCAIGMIPMTTNQACCNLMIDETIADYRFVYYALTNAYSTLASLANGGAQQNLNAQLIKDFEIPLPDLQTQHRIADILSTIDDKIENNNRINHNLEEQAQALYKSWFIDFEPFKDRKFVDSELGMIPNGWHFGTLSELATITMGQSPSGSSFNEEGNGIIFYQGRTEFGFRFPSIKLFTTEPTRFSTPRSILMSVRAPVGDINVSKKRCCIGRGLASIEPFMKSYSFVLYTIKGQSEQLDLYNGEGTVFGSINRKELEGLSVIIPPEDIINSFNELVTPLDTKIEELSDENDNLQIERDTLLPQLMSGSLTC